MIYIGKQINKDKYKLDLIMVCVLKLNEITFIKRSEEYLVSTTFLAS